MIDGQLYQRAKPVETMNEEVNTTDAITDLEEWHERMKADRAWLELTADQFQPHSHISMNAWLRARQDLEQTTSFFQSSLQQANQLTASGEITMTHSVLNTLIRAEMDVRE